MPEGFPGMVVLESPFCENNLPALKASISIQAIDGEDSDPTENLIAIPMLYDPNFVSLPPREIKTNRTRSGSTTQHSSMAMRPFGRNVLHLPNMMSAYPWFMVTRRPHHSSAASSNPSLKPAIPGSK
ncbi:hypothetical protein F5Y04DRAFT_283636 [Hypomontagnella monticulosa]|nr:hypothetical protein F5Y04DRAFT_283636 [Hypomontagnella monticulosa]